MKKIVLFLLLFVATSLMAVAQTDSVNVSTDQKELAGPDDIDFFPEYPGGAKGLYKFLRKEIKYPDIALQYNVEGRVIMVFVVEKDGSVSQVMAEDCTINDYNRIKFEARTPEEQQLLREQFAFAFAKEGARVVRAMKRWKAGYKINEVTGKKEYQRVRFHLPINFSL